MAENAITITYTYRFTSGAERSFDLHLDSTTLALQRKQQPDPPLWTLLTMHQCANCPLDNEKHIHL